MGAHGTGGGDPRHFVGIERRIVIRKKGLQRRLQNSSSSALLSGSLHADVSVQKGMRKLRL